MTCYHPITAWRLLGVKNENGKSVMQFKPSNRPCEVVELPCGQCIGCRIDRSKQWALRCVHESSLFKNNCFITLTYNEKSVNSLNSLIKSDFQKFMKRLRKMYCGLEPVSHENGVVEYPIRFFHCGEYGEKLLRPHYHACLFNFDFSDKYLWSVRDGVRLYRSKSLEALWPYGYCTVGDVTYQSAAYVARYITKKVNGKKQAAHYCRVDKETGETVSITPEYITMSRRPGIGKRWFEKYEKDVFPKDFVTYDGKKFRSPRYYDKIYDSVSPASMDVIKKRRVKSASKYADNNTTERRCVREVCLKSKMKRCIRSLENG